MKRTGRLERGYRRLLAWYPARHRRVHEEEMLGVLLAAAREGQRRPRPGEAANLIRGALKIRLAPAPPDARLEAWRDALACVSVALPLLMLIKTVGARLIVWIAYPAGATSPVEPGLVVLMQGQLLLAVLVLLRLRRTAVVAALAMAVFFAGAMASTGVFGASSAEFNLLVVLLEAAALAASAGPRRGLEILRGTPGLLLVLAGAALAVAQVSWFWLLRAAGIRLLSLAVIVELLAGLAVVSPLGRRVLLLLLIPGAPLAFMIVTIGDPAFRAASGVFGNASGGYLAGLYLVPVLIAGPVVAAILRARRRAIARGTPPA